jgi:hypothetical protein
VLTRWTPARRCRPGRTHALLDAEQKSGLASNARVSKCPIQNPPSRLASWKKERGFAIGLVHRTSMTRQASVDTICFAQAAVWS